MQFNSYIFILLFMPITIVGYYLLNRISHTAGKIGLISASVIFYVYAGWDVAAGLAVSIILNYFFALYLLSSFTAFPDHPQSLSGAIRISDACSIHLSRFKVVK